MATCAKRKVSFFIRDILCAETSRHVTDKTEADDICHRRLREKKRREKSRRTSEYHQEENNDNDIIKTNNNNSNNNNNSDKVPQKDAQKNGTPRKERKSGVREAYPDVTARLPAASVQPVPNPGGHLGLGVTPVTFTFTNPVPPEMLLWRNYNIPSTPTHPTGDLQGIHTSFSAFSKLNQHVHFPPNHQNNDSHVANLPGYSTHPLPPPQSLPLYLPGLYLPGAVGIASGGRRDVLGSRRDVVGSRRDSVGNPSGIGPAGAVGRPGVEGGGVPGAGRAGTSLPGLRPGGCRDCLHGAPGGVGGGDRGTGHLHPPPHIQGNMLHLGGPHGGGFSPPPLSKTSLPVPIPIPVYLRTRASPNGDGNTRPRKCRRSRTVFSELQLMGLERRFEEQKYLSTPDRGELACTLGLTQVQVKTWYQNRRMKWKKQVLQGGATEPPTKPKGRPRKESTVTIVTTDAASSANEKTEEILVDMTPKSDMDSDSDVSSDVESDVNSDVNSDVDIQST